MKQLLASCIFGAATCLTAVCATPNQPLWLRNTALSPDGSTIAFTFKGDVYTVPFVGGNAKQLTTSSAYDTNPVWSPDGKSLAFSSDRNGSLDIYIVPATGGTPRRITTDSGTEKPLSFLNDSTILFSANIMPAQTAAQGAFQAQVYQVGIDGGRPRMYASVPMGAVSVGKDGKILYQDKKGYEDVLRKHERSSGTSDIWLIDTNGTYTKLTDFQGHDLEPIWLPGGNEYYYVSEQPGTLNVYKRNLQGKETQLTNLANHPVRSLTANADGSKLAFSWNGEIFTLVPGQEPAKVNVMIIGDDYDADLVKGYRDSGAGRIVPSPKGDEVAFVLRGDVYVTSAKYETTKRITNTDGQERTISFSPDGRTLVYDSDRDGQWKLFTSKINDDKEKTFAYASEITEMPLYSSEYPAQQPAFSPDGKKIAFLENRTILRVLDLDSKQVNTALEGKYNYSYSDGDITFEWSPDSRWLIINYIGVGGWNNSDIALVKADGTEVIDLTESGYSDNTPKWALEGKAITYSSGKYGYRSHGSWGEEEDVFLMVLDGEAWDDFKMTEEEVALKEKADEENKDGEDEAKDKGKDKKKDKKKDKDKADKKDDVKPLVFDLNNRKYRVARLTDTSSQLGDYYLSKKGDKLYYIARGTDGETALMMRDLKKDETKVLTKGVYGSICPDKDGENLFVGMKKISIPGGDVETIPYSAPYSRKPSAEREYIYDHAWQQVKDKFYDEKLHGVDWDLYGEAYRKFLPFINNNYDFATLLSELLGELNASHTGGRYYAPGASMPVARLGAFFDDSYQGNGLMVTEVMARGPLSTKSANVNPGDIIISIDGNEIAAGEDYNYMLEGKADKKVRLGVQKPNGSIEYVTVKPVGSVSDLLYQRWVENNEKIVDNISGGRIGYVHVQGMNSPSFREVYSKLLGKYRNCDAVVVDTRYNGGGWLHNDIALLLSGHEYVRYSPRGQYIGSDPFSQWTKPSVMLVNESNYSDAHGTPYTYQTLGIGEVVGAPIPGTMTAVWWETQIDPTLVFGIPQVTSLDRKGKPLENQQLNPDILIYNNPADVQAGKDAQLEGATKHLMKKLNITAN